MHGRDDRREVIRRGVGTQFDPGVVDAFEKVLPKLREIQHEFSDAEDDHPQADVLTEVESLSKAG